MKIRKMKMDWYSQHQQQNCYKRFSKKTYSMYSSTPSCRALSTCTLGHGSKLGPAHVPQVSLVLSHSRVVKQREGSRRYIRVDPPPNTGIHVHLAVIFSLSILLLNRVSNLRSRLSPLQIPPRQFFEASITYKLQ